MFVRKFEAADWAVYKAMRLEALRLHQDVYGTSHADMADRPNSEWEDIVSQDDAAFFGLYDGGDAVGIAGIFTHKSEPRTGILIAGYIREAYRGRGLSRLLYQARIDWAKNPACSTVF